jgi:hypothetical protein
MRIPSLHGRNRPIPGGYFVTNYAVFPSAPMESSASLVTKIENTRQHSGDTLFWYMRRPDGQ